MTRPPAVSTDEDVVGLEVAVDEPGRVGRRQAAPGLDENADDLEWRARARSRPLAQRSAFDQLHRQEELVAEGAHVEDGHDVRVGELGDRLRLVVQAPASLAVDAARRAAAAHQLESHLALEVGVVGLVDRAHPAHAELAQHEEAADDRGVAVSPRPSPS